MRQIIFFILCIALNFSCFSQNKKVNILFIMSDDHCERAIGIYPSRLSKLNPTPNIDALAKKGMVFDNVFCTNSICTPSRATIMTGQYSHVNGVYDLYNGLPGKQHYLSREMKNAGYTTAVVGKWHLEESPENFDYFSVLPGQGKYFNPVLHVSEGGEKRLVRYSSALSRKINVIDTKGHSSDVLTDVTLDWLENKRDKSKPFFLMHHFKAPHGMFENAKRYDDYLKDVFIPEPDNLYNQPGEFFGSEATRGRNDSLLNVIGSTISPQPDKRNHSKKYLNKISKHTVRDNLTDRELTHYTYQLYLKEYLRCVKGIDDNLGRIMDYLKENDLIDNTIIVYTSDQGMMLGEHDYIDKRWFYEESAQMPLIIHYPEFISEGSRNDWLINNTDFAPTLLELAGVKKPAYMQGNSFVNALKGKKEPEAWRKETYYRYWMHMAHGHPNPAHFGIRTKKYKLIFYYGMDYTNIHKEKIVQGKDGNRFWGNTPAAWELYDLEKDPMEMVNQYSNLEYATIASNLKQRLLSLRKEIGDTDEHFPEIKEVFDENLYGN